MSIDELFKVLETKERDEAYKWFVPNMVEGNNQLDVLLSMATLTFTFGGNRSGKTYTGAIALLIVALGWSPEFLCWFEDYIRSHPFLLRIKIPPQFCKKGMSGFVPITDEVRKFHRLCHNTKRRFFIRKEDRFAGNKLCWVVSKDTTQQIDAAQAVLSGYLPRDEIARNSRNERQLMQSRGAWIRVFLKNGSKIELKTYEQGREHFQGANVNYFWSDEECPEDVWNEILLRIVQTKGRGIVTMTPLKGLTFMFDRYYEPWKDGDKTYPVYFLDSTKNPYISGEDIEEMVRGMSEQEKKARLKGEFVHREGLVYTYFDREKHLYDDLAETKDKYIWFIGADFGTNHNTGVVWVGMDKNKHFWVDCEYVKNNASYMEHSTNINEKSYKTRVKYLSPEAKQSFIEFGKFGIIFQKAVNDVAAGITIVNGLFQSNRLHINKKCVNLIYELEHYRFDERARSGIYSDARVIKKDDDVVDALRYCLASRPEAAGGQHIKLKRFEMRPKLRTLHPLYKTPVVN